MQTHPVDLTQATISGGTMPLYKAGNPPHDLGQSLMGLTMAFVYAEVTDNERFFENVTVNRGFRVRVFDDLEQAVQWLEQA